MRQTCIRFFQKLEQKPLSLQAASLGFLAIVILRLMVELSLDGFMVQSFESLFFLFSHTFLFFLFSFLLLLLLVGWLTKTSLPKVLPVLLFGFFIITTPPIIDKLIFGKEFFWSFYAFDSLPGLWHRYLTFFGESAHIGITYGPRIETALASLFVGLYTWTKRRSIIWGIIGTWLTYTLLFVLATFPAWITFLLLASQKPILAINEVNVAELFLSPEALFARGNIVDLKSVLSSKMSLVYALLASLTLFALWFKQAPKYLMGFLAHIRLPQVLYHGGLYCLGILLALNYTDTTLQFSFFHWLGFLLALVAIGLAWTSSCVINDIYDQAIDHISNPTRPLPQKLLPQEDYFFFGLLFAFTSLFFALIVSFPFGLILLGYHVLAWIYSAPPFRFKTIIWLATPIAALAALLILVAGYTAVHPSHTLTDLPQSLLFFLFVAYSVSLPLKDFKDIAGDQAHGSRTLPVLWGEEKARFVLAVALFVVFVSTVFVFHFPELFIVALFFGSLAFWTIHASQAKKRFLSYTLLPFNILLIVFLYGAFLFLVLR